MSKLTLAEIKKLAKLSNIYLSEQEEVFFQQEVESILTMIDKLQSVDTGNLEETSQVSGNINIWREDTLPQERETSTEELLKNAPDKYQDYIKVKRVLK
jgi:aspartyl-tRNA(Asn)/glutamyl-tRNA(Gln) amidotransferase subunit C